MEVMDFVDFVEVLSRALLKSLEKLVVSDGPSGEETVVTVLRSRIA